MNELQKDILTATMFITGLVGFISGEFIISSTLLLQRPLPVTFTSTINAPKLENFQTNDFLPKTYSLKTFIAQRP